MPPPCLSQEVAHRGCHHRACHKEWLLEDATTCHHKGCSHGQELFADEVHPNRYVDVVTLKSTLESEVRRKVCLRLLHSPARSKTSSFLEWFMRLPPCLPTSKKIMQIILSILEEESVGGCYLAALLSNQSRWFSWRFSQKQAKNLWLYYDSIDGHQGCIQMGAFARLPR